jgi:hypothetical protein
MSEYITYPIDFLFQYKNIDYGIPLELIEFNNICKLTNNLWRTEKPLNRIMENTTNRNSDDHIYSIAKNILNKLSNENFKLLMNEIKSIKMTKLMHIQTIINLIIKKSINEPLFTPVYAKLCFELRNHVVHIDKKDIFFKNELLQICQEQFNDYINNLNEDNSDEIIGFIIFIGELYNVNLIFTPIIEHCIDILFENIEQVNDNFKFYIQAICKLLFTSGKELHNKDKTYSISTMNKLSELQKHKNIKSKERFMITDLKDSFNNLKK